MELLQKIPPKIKQGLDEAKSFIFKNSNDSSDFEISDRLTFIGLRVGVLDVSGEFGENIHACCVGLRVTSSQTRIPEPTERSMKIHIRSSHHKEKFT